MKMDKEKIIGELKKKNKIQGILLAIFTSIVIFIAIYVVITGNHTFGAIVFTFTPIIALLFVLRGLQISYEVILYSNE